MMCVCVCVRVRVRVRVCVCVWKKNYDKIIFERSCCKNFEKF